jgi:hypothetical protein
MEARLRTPIHSSSMLQVNCPILHDVGLTSPLAILEPTPVIPHTYGIHDKQKTTLHKPNYSWSDTLNHKIIILQNGKR